MRMARLCRIGFQFLTKSIPVVTNTAIPKPSILTYSFISRPFSVSPVKLLKQICETKEGNDLVVEAHYVESPREKLLVKPPEKLVDGKHSCYLCALDLDIKFTDVLILKQFMRSDGCMLPRRVTKLCKMQQIRVGKLVAMAQKAGLMRNITPKGCKKKLTKRVGWKRFNTYYDEKTIFMRRIPDQNDKFKRR